MQHIVYQAESECGLATIYLRCDSAVSCRRVMAAHAGAVCREMTAADWERYGVPPMLREESPIPSLPRSTEPPTVAAVEWKKRGARV